MTIRPPDIEERLERGEIVTFEPCPFALPAGDNLAFLMQQQLNSAIHKNISFNPANQTVTGFDAQSPPQTKRLQDLLRDFSERTSGFLAGLLPRYAQAWQPDRASLRPKRKRPGDCA